MTSVNEKELDRLLDEAFKNNAQFCEWFLSKTKFSRHRGQYPWSRSNNPWSQLDYTDVDPDTGIQTITSAGCETDVFVVFHNAEPQVFALHIENKLSSGKFEPFQPERYRQRAAAWIGIAKWGSYTDSETVLVAPHRFFERNKVDATKFDRFISHEEISKFIPDFAPS